MILGHLWINAEFKDVNWFQPNPDSSPGSWRKSSCRPDIKQMIESAQQRLQYLSETGKQILL